MKTIVSSLVVLGTGLLSPQSVHEVATDYGRERTLRIESTTELFLETTSREVLVDGEPMDRPFSGSSLREKRRVVLLDQHLQADAGAPRHVRRTFEVVENETSMSFGENEMDGGGQAPLAGLVLDLSVDEDGEVDVELVEGAGPDDEALLEGHALELCLDALLPAEAREEKEDWELEDALVREALGLALDARLFPTPEREAREAGAGRGEGGRRGGRGARGGAARFLQDAEWEGTATLAAVEEEHEGEACTVITLALEAAGELPEREGFGGGRGRGRAYEPGLAVPARRAGTFEVELEGRLVFSNAARRPVLLELSGTLSTDQSSEFERQGRTMSMSSTQAGTFEHEVTLSEE